jgi:beta-barrel assembly-enhancing protease
MKFRALMLAAALSLYGLSAFAQTSQGSSGQQPAPPPTATSQTTPTATDQSTNSAPAATNQNPSDKNAPAYTGQNPPPAAGGTPAPTDLSNGQSAPANAPTANDQTNTQTSATGKQIKHTGGEDDVDAIGNRKVGNRGFGDWYSLNSEIAMGKSYAQQVESSVKLIQDPTVNEYVNRIGQNLVRNSDAKVPFTIKVIDSDEINAFALPGGFFYVNSGLILAADNESELAGVMAHEIAHVCARHAMRQMTRAQIANFASIPLIFIGGWAGYAIQSAASFALPMTFLTFSRGFESEADYLGLQYMYKTGYDPQSFVAFFEKIQAKEKKKPGTLSKAFSTHPQTPDRIEKSQQEIATILPARDEYVLDTSEFQTVKTRLAAIENKRKVTNDKNGNAPTLRRTTTSDSTSNSGSDSSNSGDDHPTLKRRDADPNSN